MINSIKIQAKNPKNKAKWAQVFKLTSIMAFKIDRQNLSLSRLSILGNK